MKKEIASLFFLFSLFSGVYAQGVNADMLEEINAERRKRLRKPLVYTDKHQAKTDAWARATVSSTVHSYKDPYYGECVSKDAPREDIIKDFMASKPHKKVLMARRARKVCIGVYEKDHIYYTVIRTFR